LELYSLTAHELSNLIRKREISVIELVESVLNRINDIEDILGSYITVTAEHALKCAQTIQKEIDKGDEVAPLAGIPVAVKDNICTEGVLTTCGSRMLHNFIPPYNATVIDKIQENKMIIVGKTNLDEFAMGSTTENSCFKKTRNPWNINRVPGGSSGGSAASVASGEAIIALGSDTGGSIRQPASFCGVVGLKPTYGAVSRFGLIAYASSMDQIGPIAKDVTDCALMMNAICGYDHRDSTSADMRHPDYTGFLSNELKNIRIGIPREYMSENVDPAVKDCIYNAIKVYETLGVVCEETTLPLTEYAVPVHYLISSAEASSSLARYDGIKYGYRAEKFKNLTELYKKTRSEGFGDEVKRRIMLGTFSLSSGYYDAYYSKALKVRSVIIEEYEKVLSKYDLILGPTTLTTAYALGEKVDDPLKMYFGDMCTVSANITGLPAISVPCGFDKDGMPVGMQLIGRLFSEGLLLKAAYSFECQTDYHKMRLQVEEQRRHEI
jgi:aspartyl-tRNA(Asn)/glutamyl-tRNA(Gln) amidotransferase subunit A